MKLSMKQQAAAAVLVISSATANADYEGPCRGDCSPETPPTQVTQQQTNTQSTEVKNDIRVDSSSEDFTQADAKADANAKTGDNVFDSDYKSAGFMSTPNLAATAQASACNEADGWVGGLTAFYFGGISGGKNKSEASGHGTSLQYDYYDGLPDTKEKIIDGGPQETKEQALAKLPSDKVRRVFTCKYDEWKAGGTAHENAKELKQMDIFGQGYITAVNKACNGEAHGNKHPASITHDRGQCKIAFYKGLQVVSGDTTAEIIKNMQDIQKFEAEFKKFEEMAYPAR